MRYYHQLRRDTKKLPEPSRRKTVLETVQEFPGNEKQLAELLGITNKEAEKILRYEKLPTMNRLRK